VSLSSQFLNEDAAQPRCRTLSGEIAGGYQAGWQKQGFKYVHFDDDLEHEELLGRTAVKTEGLDLEHGETALKRLYIV
jgi:hypothetical protein